MVSASAAHPATLTTGRPFADRQSLPEQAARLAVRILQAHRCGGVRWCRRDAAITGAGPQRKHIVGYRAKLIHQVSLRFAVEGVEETRAVWSRRDRAFDAQQRQRQRPVDDPVNDRRQWFQRERGMPQEPNPVVLKQVEEISCLPVNTRACSSTRHYTTHSYPQQCGGVSAVRDGVALQRRSSRTGETDLPFLSSAVRLPRGPLPTLPG